MGAASLLSGLALGVRNCAYGGRFAASVAFERVDRQVCRMGLVLGAFGGHEHGAWFRILHCDNRNTTRQIVKAASRD